MTEAEFGVDGSVDAGAVPLSDVVLGGQAHRALVAFDQLRHGKADVTEYSMKLYLYKH